MQLTRRQLPALRSVHVMAASGHNLDKFCPFSGWGDVYLFGNNLVVVLLTVEKDDDSESEDDVPLEKENTPPALKRELHKEQQITEGLTRQS